MAPETIHNGHTIRLSNHGIHCVLFRLVRDAPLGDEGSGDEEIFQPDLGIQPKAPVPDQPIPGPVPDSDTGVVPKPAETNPTSTPPITQSK